MATDIRVLSLSSFDQGTVFGPDAEPKQTIFETSATQKHRLGARYTDGDRIFRYAKSGASGSIVKAKMTQSQVVETKTQVIVQTGHAWAVGDVSGTMLVTTGGSFARDEFVDGYFFANKVAAVGDTYRVIASEITTTDTIMQLELETAIRTAISVTTECSLQPNRWRDVVIFPTTKTGYATGVPLVDVTDGYYFWAQTGGPCPLIVDGSGTSTIGDSCGFGGNDAGTCTTRTTLQASFGNVLVVGQVDEASLVNLSIDH